MFRQVQKPAQYLGNEVNAIHKDFDKAQVRVCLVFPDAYEMGMSHVGLKILYEILNNCEGVVAERSFAPLPDMEAKLRENNIPWFSLESKTPLKEFDIIGITLPYELVYTNAINILDLARIPVFAQDRRSNHPIVLAGGTQSYNPEPMADFLDVVAIGDGEELILDVVNALSRWKENFHIDKIAQNKNAATSRDSLLDSLTNIPGVYVPKFFAPAYNDDGTIKEIKPLKANYKGVAKRIVKDLNQVPYPTKLVVPTVKLIHDRIGIEIQRGCTRACRFCQAGYIERPTRQRAPEKVIDIAKKSFAATGIDEISLLSLSAGDYDTIVPTLKELNSCFSNDKVAISVPATRTETLTPELIEQVKKVRMSGFTIAPEAGSERMRRVINKGNKIEDLLTACHNAFGAGYRLIKFYYMCGLPFETDDDVVGIANESHQAYEVGKTYTRNVHINVSVSSFVPKPFTPFQWEPQMTVQETERKHNLVKHNLKVRALQFKCHDARMSLLEGLFARGDRRLSRVIYQAFKNGCRFDEWSEHFDFAKWQKTFAETDVDVSFYVHRRRSYQEVLPWDHLFTQMHKLWLWDELVNAQREAYVPDCSVDKCAAFCGVCDFKQIKNRIFVVDERELAAKKGNREWYGRFGSESGPIGQTPSQQNPSPQTELYRLRTRFAKVGDAALMGHLELVSALKRAILRAQFPVAYSTGFHPQMRLSLSMALSLGIESEHEYFDLIFKKTIQPNEFIEKINTSLPDGLKILHADFVDLKTSAVYPDVSSVAYEVTFPKTATDEWKNFLVNIKDLKEGKGFIFERSKPGKPGTRRLDVKDYVRQAELILHAGEKKVSLELNCDVHGTMKPTEVIAALTNVATSELAKWRVKKMAVTFQQP